MAEKGKRNTAQVGASKKSGRPVADISEFLRSNLADDDLRRLTDLDNAILNEFVADAIVLCEPQSVMICDDSEEMAAWTRRLAVESGEEKRLAIEGHTCHFDGMQDQGRDREVTKYLVPAGESLSKALNQIERDKGLEEVRGLLKGVMRGRIMIVRFLTLGPVNSIFSIPCVECTDSFYVSHSMNLLYRPGYEQFKRTLSGRQGDRDGFFRILHSAGKVDENMVSAEPDKKRIYIDHTRDMVYSVNTQYAGNTLGLKKLALRLTIRKADREGWLAEHMFLMGVHGPETKDGRRRKTYFAGAFPSACGKTATAMLAGETIIGDDLAYLRNIGGETRAVNAEAGIFGIIQNVSPTNDPQIYKLLTSPGEVIFSNVLVKNDKPYWLGMGCELPQDGVNFSGPWRVGKVDAQDNPIPPAHKNARYTVCLKAVENVDPELDNPDGVHVGAIIYGGRNAHSHVPVQQSFDWNHGIIAYGASLQTETSFAIIGQEGVSELNVMSIQDFLAIPVGKYIMNNLEYGRGLKKRPLIFGVNYFLRDKAGAFVNAVCDKAVWIKWMELRVHDEAPAVKAPTGWIPGYEDLVRLFRGVLGKDYTRADYVNQFTIRVQENLAKIGRVEKFYRGEVPDTPGVLFEILGEQQRRLEEAQKKYGDYISPFDLAGR